MNTLRVTILSLAIATGCSHADTTEPSTATAQPLLNPSASGADALGSSAAKAVFRSFERTGKDLQTALRRTAPLTVESLIEAVTSVATTAGWGQSAVSKTATFMRLRFAENDAGAAAWLARATRAAPSEIDRLTGDLPVPNSLSDSRAENYRAAIRNLLVSRQLVEETTAFETALTALWDHLRTQPVSDADFRTAWTDIGWYLTSERADRLSALDPVARRLWNRYAQEHRLNAGSADRDLEMHQWAMSWFSRTAGRGST